jgi:NAD(P)-dependent dehydrogenase (short-subunit alcohol dehydrogenase family)
MDIADQVILITGGASGLGEGTARRLVAQGARIVIADVQAERGQALAQELGGAFVPCDVTDEVQAQAAVRAATALGPLRGLVTCAGIAPAAKVVGKEGAHPLDLFRRTIDINLVGSFNLLRLAAEAMSANEPNAASERGVLVMTASVAAYDGQMGQAAYAASKGAIAAMTLPIARDLARFGIRCVSIAPGIFATPMMSAMPEAVQASLAASVPFPQRLGRPDDFARLVQHVFENEMLNGEVIRLDGAIRMPPR